LRIRPFSREEKEKKEESCLQIVDDQTVLVTDPKANGSSEAKFEFTRIFDEHSNQEEVFEDAALPVVEHFLKGSIFFSSY
jgi:hypothetical protein